ncbi:MAG: alpha/beta hydrolase [Sandaracinaceae bacterium]|nr:alpha/beta hydrolase [Sandaracinaceae bacterium]
MSPTSSDASTDWVTDSLMARLRAAPAAERERFLEFRRAAPRRRIVLGTTAWTFLDSAPHEVGGAMPVLALAGATCVAEAGYRTIEHLAARRRVLAPDYPPSDTLSGLADGIARVLDAIAVPAVHVIGGSYGGLVAQVFARRHPSRAKSLVLSHTFLPDPDSARRLRRLARVLSWVPWALLRRVFEARLGKLFPAGDRPELAVPKALFAEAMQTYLTKAHVVGMMRQLADPALFAQLGPGRVFSGPVLLLMAEDDPATPRETREALRAAYPQAQSRLFSGAGHLTAVLQQAQYLAAIDAFLEEHGRD